MKCGLVIHVPHASKVITEEYRKGFLLSDGELERETALSGDAYCDELFDAGFGTAVVFGYNRLLCDVERFRDDELEINAKKGNGFFYTHTPRGVPLRRDDPVVKEKVLTEIYDKHHARLFLAVEETLGKHDRCLIIDGHSFSDDPRIGEGLPDFCVGTDGFHTPPRLSQAAADVLRSYGYTVEINRPFSGAIVPMAYYGKDKRVLSLMIEINKRLYLRGGTVEKSKDFTKIKEVCTHIIKALHAEANGFA